MRNSSSSSNESTDDAPLRNIIISSGTPKVETGIRIFDPDSGILYNIFYTASFISREWDQGKWFHLSQFSF